MRVLLLGASGVCGSVALRHLCLSKGVDEVVAADIRPLRAGMLVKKLGLEKARTLKLDISDRGSLAEAMKDADVVANATPYIYNLHVMEAALEARRSLTDLGGMFYTTREQMKRSRDFEEAGLTVLMGCGLAPGIADVLAKKGAEHVDAVESIHIYYGEVNFTPALYKWSFRALLDELTLRPVIYKDGKFVQCPPMSGKEYFDFPEPVGTRLCVYSVYSGVATLPLTVGKGVKLVEAKYGFSDTGRLEAVVEALGALGLLSEEPVRVGDVEVRPRDLLLSCAPPAEPEVEDAVSVVVIVRGRKDGDLVEARYSLVQGFHRVWRASALAYLTGLSLSLATQMLGSGEVEARGVLSLEGAVEPDRFLRLLKHEGLRIEEEIRVRREL